MEKFTNGQKLFGEIAIIFMLYFGYNLFISTYFNVREITLYESFGFCLMMFVVRYYFRTIIRLYYLNSPNEFTIKKEKESKVKKEWGVGMAVKKRGNKYVVTPKNSNKVLGTHSSKSAAERQLRAIEASKNKKKKR